jgi:L-fuculose-phosphate aldolase
MTRIRSDDIRFRIAAARRILARAGCESDVAGHVSARDPDGEDAFWVSPFEFFDEALPERVIQVGIDRLELRRGAWEPSPAIRFHAAIYRARPDVKSVIHTHSHHACVLASTGEPVGMYHTQSVLFFEEQTFYVDDGSKPPVDGESIAKTLGNRSVVWLRNHGTIVAARSLEAATILTLTLERAARLHIEARAIGGSEIPEPEVRRGKLAYHQYYLPQMWDACFRRLRRSDPDLFEGVDG